MEETATPEELDSTQNAPSENPSEETIPTNDIAAVNLNQDSENMEVHHHPQLHHKPKPWKEYFLEFLMIFLAVTLGFFAENIREHFVETERARDYAQSLYDDLKIDTTTIQRTYDEKNWIHSKFDSAEIMLSSKDSGKNNEFIYYVERYIAFNDVFSTQDVTYQQLKSSGNFRYMKNVALYKGISDYYNLYSRYQSVDGTFGRIKKNELSEIEAKLFNVNDLTSLDNHNPTNFYDLALPSKRKLEPLVNDKMTLKLLYIQIADANSRTSSSKLILGWLKSSATNLINELKKEYDLK